MLIAVLPFFLTSLQSLRFWFLCMQRWHQCCQLLLLALYFKMQHACSIGVLKSRQLLLVRACRWVYLHLGMITHLCSAFFMSTKPLGFFTTSSSSQYETWHGHHHLSKDLPVLEHLPPGRPFTHDLGVYQLQNSVMGNLL